MTKKRGRLKKFLIYGLLSFLLLLLIGVVYFYFKTKIDPPEVSDTSILDRQAKKIGNDYYSLENNWLKKNKGGLWELYVEGEPFERGATIGKLAQPLIRKQEDAFISQIKKIVPDESYLKFLKYFIAWFNRDIDTFIPEEYKQEIYGESFAASHEYDFIGNPYHRMLNYHAAHDIGHALQDKNMVVGCTSFAVWGDKSKDGSLLIGRNFDFYVGDEFAEEKIVLFFNPTQGHKFMIVTWGGMIGAVSGMNNKGLTVTINAGKSEIPTGAATPISILAREILQYASTIDEAYEIAKNRRTFVAEALMIGSAKDKKTAIIEKSPGKIDIVYPAYNEIICSNHFRSKAFKNEDINLKNIKESASFYRYQRMEELLDATETLDFRGMASILRDQKGKQGKNIGMGNELAVNQLISHHSIIFKPEQGLVWVSSNPFQLGQYYAYDLNKIFDGSARPTLFSDISIDSLNIPADSFLLSDGYEKFKEFRAIKNEITNYLSRNKAQDISPEKLIRFEKNNPEYYHTYSLLGDYYHRKGDLQIAKTHYKTALTKEIATLKERKHIEEQLIEITH